MWFKNLQVYRLPKGWSMTAEQLNELLQSNAFTAAGSNELIRQGWDKPRPNGDLVHVVNKQMLIMLGTEKKLLPATVVNQVAKARAAEMEEQQGFAPGKKAMKELKERVFDELLPRAFAIRSNTFCWIDPVNGWLVVDAASPAKADGIIKMLLKAVDRMPIESLRVQRSPVGVMTAWLQDDEAPAGFTVDMDTELRATGEGKAAVRYVRHTLEPEEVRRHIAAGKQCTRLAMTWDSKISFVLTEALAIKGIKPLDVMKENDAVTRNDDELFDGDFMLMTGELAKLLQDVIVALGGEAAAADGDATNSASRASVSMARADASIGRPAETQDMSASGDDPLYEQARQIVLAHKTASVSLVQRQLGIGYNRAANLLEQMEVQGVVGAANSVGKRELVCRGMAT
jgi:recombination associated protein RdgC